MGCDIHLFVEKKEMVEWASVDKWELDEHAQELRVPYGSAFYDDRNYSLFSILANVRNGYGVAGIDTGNGYIPISEPRGLPNNISSLVQNESVSWGSDGHSHSWFTLKELLDYDWTQTTIVRGVLSTRQYVDWNRWSRKNGENPNGWSGGVSGGRTRNITGPEMEKLCEGMEKLWGKNLDEEIQKRGLDHTYASFHWGQHYYSMIGRFWSHAIPRLLRIGNPEDVRIVFWFDN